LERSFEKGKVRDIDLARRGQPFWARAGALLVGWWLGSRFSISQLTGVCSQIFRGEVTEHSAWQLHQGELPVH